jgi:hypothetical protein
LSAFIDWTAKAVIMGSFVLVLLQLPFSPWGGYLNEVETPPGFHEVLMYINYYIPVGQIIGVLISWAGVMGMVYIVKMALGLKKSAL